MKNYPKSYFNYLGSLCRYILKETFHDEYEVHICAENEPHNTEDTITKAEVLVDDVYLSFLLKVYPILFDEWKGGEYQKVARTICHEMAHIVIHPLSKMLRDFSDSLHMDEINDVVERQTQRVTNIVFNGLPEGFYTPANLKRLSK